MQGLTKAYASFKAPQTLCKKEVGRLRASDASIPSDCSLANLLQYPDRRHTVISVMSIATNCLAAAANAANHARHLQQRLCANLTANKEDSMHMGMHSKELTRGCPDAQGGTPVASVVKSGPHRLGHAQLGRAPHTRLATPTNTAPTTSNHAQPTLSGSCMWHPDAGCPHHPATGRAPVF